MFEIVNTTARTTYAPLNTTIDADENYRDNSMSGCGCKGGVMEGLGLGEMTTNTWLGLSLVAFGALWLWMSKPDLEDEYELQRLRSRMGLNRG